MRISRARWRLETRTRRLLDFRLPLRRLPLVALKQLYYKTSDIKVYSAPILAIIDEEVVLVGFNLDYLEH